MDERDGLWNVVFDAYYDAYFEELAAESLSRRWGLLDDLTKGVVAITATGSAIAGWTLWTLPGWRLLWAAFAGAAALLSIPHATLKVPERVRSFEETRRAFCAVRVDLETLRDTMRANHAFPVVQTQNRWAELRNGYSAAMQRVQSDLLRSKRFLYKTKGELNSQLADQIEGGEEG